MNARARILLVSAVFLGILSAVTARAQTPTEVPNCPTHTVRPGETLAELAEALDVPLADLLRLNNLTAEDEVQPGDVLAVPDGDCKPVGVGRSLISPTSGSTATSRRTPTRTPTDTPVPPTHTPTATATRTPLPPTATRTPTHTPTFTPSNTSTYTPTNTPTYTPTPTNTPTSTFTPSNTPTPTNTPTYTPTFTPTPSDTLALPDDLLAIGVINASQLHKLIDLSGREARRLSPGLRVLIAGEPGSPLRLLDAGTGQPVGASSAPHTGGAVFSADGRFLALSTARVVELWNTATGRKLAELTLLEQDDRPAYLALGPTGRYLVVRKAAFYVWDVLGRPAVIIALSAPRSGAFQGAIAFSPDGARMASSAVEGAVIFVWPVSSRLNEINTGAVLRPIQLEGHTSTILSLAFSPDNQLLASAGADNTVRLWLPSARREVAVLTGHTAPVRSIAFSPDGTLLASAGDDGTVRVWDVAAGEEVALLRTDTMLVTEVAFSTDSKVIFARDGDRIRLWGVVRSSEVSLTCRLVVPRVVNLRTGPGTNFARQSQLAPGATVTIDGQAVGADGYTWYRLSDGAWVRADLVNPPAECEHVPVVAP